MLIKAAVDDLKNIQDIVFDGKDMSIDFIKQAWVELSAERTNLTDRRLSTMQFADPPPEDSEIEKLKISRVAGLLLGGMLGGGLGVIMTIFRSWWRRELTVSDVSGLT